ncbi:MAG: ATP synthase subunit I [Candidatus Poribacteria bacterium]
MPDFSDKHRDKWGIDLRFLSRVYRIGILADILISCGLCFYSIKAGLSFAVGGAISLSLLWSLDYIVRRTITPQPKKPKLIILLMAFLKYLAIGVAFYFILKYKWLNVPALAAGLGLAYAIIFLNGFTILLNALKENSKST